MCLWRSSARRTLPSAKVSPRRPCALSRRTLPHILGVCVGFSAVLLAVCAGLDALFARWPDLQTVLRWGGAAYLVYLGWRILRAGESQAGYTPKPLTFMEAGAFQFFNPKGWVTTLTAAAL